MSPLRQDLPAPHSPFIGRDRDITDLGHLIDTARMVTLTGAGGIGKTSMAVRLAELERDRFADGAVFVDLSTATTGAHALHLVANRLGVAENQANSLDEAVPLVLRSREVLLVLDTCERVVAPMARLCRLLLSTCPRLRLLVTSREPLRIPGENIWRVPPLSLPTTESQPPVLDAAWLSDPAALRTTVREAMRYEAVRLFADRARRARPGFSVTAENIAPIVRICQILDGVPLAVELAAARVRVLSIEQVLERLDDRFTLLNSADKGLPERQRTMRAVVEWSHALLSEPEKTLLRRLSLFVNWSLDVAEELFSGEFGDGDELLELHGSLLDKSLIVLEAEVEGVAHYRMLDTIRVYAAERLEASGEAEAYCRRTLEYGMDLVESLAAFMAEPLPWETRLQVLNRVEVNRGNIRSFLAWAVEHGMTVEGLRICVGLRSYWAVRDRHAEGAAFVASLLAAAPDGLPSALRARSLVLHGELTLGLKGAEAAKDAIEEGLRLSTRIGDEAVRAEALGSLAVVSLRLSRIDEGRGQAAECLEITRRTGNRMLELYALGTLASLADAAGDREGAEREFAAALKIAEEMGDAWHAARCHTGLGLLATHRNAFESAQEHLNTALSLFTRLRAHFDTAYCLAGLGRLAEARGESAEAWEYLSEGVRRSVASGQRLAMARSMENLARFAAAEGLTDRMVLLGAQAEALRQELGVPSRTGGMLHEFAEARLGAAASAAWRRARSMPLEEALAAALPAPVNDGVRSLTRREHQVAELAAVGLSNREIAVRLVISQATVARHVANIFAKLGISARGELAARISSGGNGFSG
ncbi:ATP-binding protein [Actinorugispora endophytica]|uniref:Putative ATPase n=1 Tax=Actinorugispora endophytica TaxID=1605990 RepID=A0A4R6V1Q6_9ACTN|nr:LuxR C-terminal-related transcriptional regulator [Actinorugispora endophytica]TDQ53813.1 putative ATPase [Actinorugispora endophytica]